MTTHQDQIVSVNGFKGSHQDDITQAIAVDGAITAKQGVVIIQKAGVLAATLAAPALADNGRILTILSLTANAHTVTQAAPGFNDGGAGSDVATFGAAKGNSMTLIAYGGIWYVLNLTGVALA